LYVKRAYHRLFEREYTFYEILTWIELQVDFFVHDRHPFFSESFFVGGLMYLPALDEWGWYCQRHAPRRCCISLNSIGSLPHDSIPSDIFFPTCYIFAPSLIPALRISTFLSPIVFYPPNFWVPFIRGGPLPFPPDDRSPVACLVFW